MESNVKVEILSKIGEVSPKQEVLIKRGNYGVSLADEGLDVPFIPVGAVRVKVTGASSKGNDLDFEQFIILGEVSGRQVAYRTGSAYLFGTIEDLCGYGIPEEIVINLREKDGKKYYEVL